MHTSQLIFACAEVETAVGARKVRNTGENNKPMMPASTTEKKSSFATDEWLAQCETAKMMDVGPVTSQDNELSSAPDVVDKSNKASNGIFTEPFTGPKWASSNQDKCISPEDRLSSAEVA